MVADWDRDEPVQLGVLRVVEVEVGRRRTYRVVAGCGPRGLPPVSRSDHQRCSSADFFDDLDQFVEAVAVAAGEVDEFLRSLDDGAAFGCSCDGDSASAPEL